MKYALIILYFFAAFASGALAHEVRPAYLQLREIETEVYDVLWKVPARDDNYKLRLFVELPKGTVNLTDPRGIIINNSYSERWTVQRMGGLAGGTIHIAGLSATMTDVLVRLVHLNGTTQVTRLTPSAPSYVVESRPGSGLVAKAYFKLGVEHIIGGVDHLLFVLGLLILVRNARRLIATITAFTVGHSFTLGGAILGLVHVPGKPIEAAIALSIALVALEIIKCRQGKPGFTARYPWIAAIMFGLLHGFGFAGALSEIGLPGSAVPMALLLFNVGIEIGQLLFIAVVLTAIHLTRYLTHYFGFLKPSWAWRVPPYAIGSIALFWFIERIAAF